MSARKGVLSKILVGGGAALLVSLMVLAAFSLGVYVGHEGLLVGTLQDFGARQVPDQRPPQAPSAPSPGLPPGRPALVGKVAGITNEGLFVRTLEGPRLIEMGGETRVLDRQGVELPPDSLRQGADVAVFGEFSVDGRTLIADAIVLVPPRQP